MGHMTPETTVGGFSLLLTALIAAAVFVIVSLASIVSPTIPLYTVPGYTGAALMLLSIPVLVLGVALFLRSR